MADRHEAAIHAALTGDWEGAHRIVQQMDDPTACWIHAILHKMEGDEANSRYWYGRSGGRIYEAFAEPGEELQAALESLRNAWIPGPRASAAVRDQETVMEMKRVSSGKLRAIGYDPRSRTLRVELDDGSTIDYAGVGDEVWRRLSSSGSPWSYYRDNIEEEYAARRAAASTDKKANPLDDLFK